MIDDILSVMPIRAAENLKVLRADLSAENARLARAAGVKIAINTDAHSIRELDYIRGGVDQARRAGFDRESVLNCLDWLDFSRLVRR